MVYIYVRYNTRCRIFKNKKRLKIEGKKYKRNKNFDKKNVWKPLGKLEKIMVLRMCGLVKESFFRKM